MTLTSTADRPQWRGISSLATSPLTVLGLVCLCLAGLLLLPVTLPIGSFYWDLFIYFDAANRIFSGQVPGVDFFTPVGPLGYWLFALVIDLFPQGQPLLIAQWSLLIVTAPLMALVVLDVDRRSKGVAFAILLPFLFFQILPFNVTAYYSYPSIDGFGIYNRQMTEILYVLAAGLLFMTSRRMLAAVIIGTMLALFFTKVTGFFAGGLLCALALATRRIDWRVTGVAVAGFLIVLAGLELSFGLVSAYLGDILALVLLNEGSLLPRFLQAASIHFAVFGPLAALIVTLFVLDVRSIFEAARAVLKAPGHASLAALLDRPVAWLAAAVFAALFVETQNTGGQGFIFVWPVLLMTALTVKRFTGWRNALVLILICASSLPYLMEVTKRSARAFVGQIKYVELESRNLKTLGRVNQRPEIMHHAAVMKTVYAEHPETFQTLADAGELPNFTLYTEPDFQLTWLMSVDEAVDAIRDYEAEHGIRFESLMNLNFVNPFPWLLDRQAPRAVAIGADPYRAVPDPDAAVLGEIRNTDLVLYPRCPITNANETLRELYAPALAGFEKITLSPCWDGYVRPEIAVKLAAIDPLSSAVIRR